MKKVLNFLIISLLFSYVSVFAVECKASDLAKLNEDANNVKVGYEVVETKKMVRKSTLMLEEESNEMEEVTEEALKITVYNVTDDIYLVETNDYNNDKKVINSSNSTNGKYSFVTDDIYNYINYKYEIFSNLKTCDTTLLKTITFTKPIFNDNAHYQICVDNPTVPVCQRYITADTGVTDATLVEKVESYLNNNGNVETTKKADNNNAATSFIKDNMYYIIGGASVIVVGAIVIYIVISKKRSTL